MMPCASTNTRAYRLKKKMKPCMRVMRLDLDDPSERIRIPTVLNAGQSVVKRPCDWAGSRGSHRDCFAFIEQEAFDSDDRRRRATGKGFGNFAFLDTSDKIIEIDFGFLNLEAQC